MDESKGVRGDEGAAGGDSGSARVGDMSLEAKEEAGSGFDCLVGVLASFASCSVSSFLFTWLDARTGTVEVGTPDVGTSAPLCNGEDLAGLDGAGLPLSGEAEGRGFGITVKEFRDCNRRFARARAWVSASGIWEMSGFGEGRISKSAEDCKTLADTGLEGDSARARNVSGEHGILGFGGTSALSHSLSLVGFIWLRSGSSLELTDAPHPLVSSIH